LVCRNANLSIPGGAGYVVFHLHKPVLNADGYAVSWFRNFDDEIVSISRRWTGRLLVFGEDENQFPSGEANHPGVCDDDRLRIHESALSLP